MPAVPDRREKRDARNKRSARGQMLPCFVTVSMSNIDLHATPRWTTRVPGDATAARNGCPVTPVTHGTTSGTERCAVGTKNLRLRSASCGQQRRGAAASCSWRASRESARAASWKSPRQRPWPGGSPWPGARVTPGGCPGRGRWSRPPRKCCASGSGRQRRVAVGRAIPGPGGGLARETARKPAADGGGGGQPAPRGG